MSKDICEAVLQIAPKALKDVVGAGDATALEFPSIPRFANARQDKRQGMMGALAGAAAGLALLALLFLLNRKVDSEKELTDYYTPPVLASIRRNPVNEKDPGRFLLNENSAMDLAENYAKLRMNLLFTLHGKEASTVLVTSAVSGEGKSTIAANLAISLAMSGKNVLLVDADLRRACQRDIFHYDHDLPGLSDVLAGNEDPLKAILHSVRKKLDILPSGSIPPNPSELLESETMQSLLAKLEQKYDMILLDVPPINIVSDPLALSKLAKGAVFVVRQHFSDHREIRKALIAAEMTGMEILGFVFYGEKIRQGSFYRRKSKDGYRYYKQYDTRAGNNRST
jgi:capsular exopolysaccharide synthesis family protein